MTQADKLSGGETMARDLIHRRLGVPADSFELRWVYEIGEELDVRTKAARAAVTEAAAAQTKAAAKSREVARDLKKSGLSGRDIAAILGVSGQRVSQLLGGAVGTMRSRVRVR